MTEINIAGIRMKNRVMVASGTFGFGEEYSKLMDLDKLGAIITKSITLKPREGNPPPRIIETPSGMLNSIGLQNPGVEKFISDHLPFLAKLKTPTIVNIAGESIEEFVELAKTLTKQSAVKGLELNISCPNVKKGGMTFGIDPELTSEAISAVKKETDLPVIAKLTPNVTDITLIAKAAEEAGADAISAINTILGMSLDPQSGNSRLGTQMGGLSGPAIRPIALRLVWQIVQAVKIAVIGIGGIATIEDAREFLAAGAKAIQIGTANFVDTETAIKICKVL